MGEVYNRKSLGSGEGPESSGSGVLRQHRGGVKKWPDWAREKATLGWATEYQSALVQPVAACLGDVWLEPNSFLLTSVAPFWPKSPVSGSPRGVLLRRQQTTLLRKVTRAQHHVGACEKCRLSGFTPNLLNSSTPLNKVQEHFSSLKCLSLHPEFYAG